MRDVILVTGGAGFIGSNFILDWMARRRSAVVNLDLLTYAGNPANLASLAGNERYRLVVGDLADAGLVASILAAHQPRAIVHLAAETHVDRSIADPEPFLRTNVLGTQVLLEQTRLYWSQLNAADRQVFRFLNVSTDEVYGSLGDDGPAFDESAAYAPNSPYAASKAAA
ncbi:MAG: dTDP-glucose 4,6-dehydratase, partial [Terracidiphilus sp.]